mgnify:CR=1 FL=1|tara:strand:+ start:12334 stop:12618 length:285 start_codon:yes stop_codon:yes gene_type:complete
MLTKIILAALVASLTFGGSQALKLAGEKELRVAADARNAALALLLAGCRARADNLTEDKDSDDEVDTLTDDELRVVPSHWLRDARTRDRDHATD